MYRRFGKRILDICFSVCILAALSPVILLSVLAVRLTSGSPVIFRQTRIGYKGRAFQMFKFRSMAVNSEHTGSGVYSDKNDARVTKVGKILRATSLDELPQLINVLKGDMSLIGPRPPLTYHPWPLEQYTQEQLHMFDVLPGITGWAQVNGRKGLEWNERIRLNNAYVNKLSFAFDVKIFFLTIYKILSNADNENHGETVKTGGYTHGA